MEKRERENREEEEENSKGIERMPNLGRRRQDERRMKMEEGKKSSN